MLVVYSEQHRAHWPEWYVADGKVRNAPEVPARAEAILAVLRARGHEVVGPGVDPWAAIGVTHDAGMVEYLKNIAGEWRAEFGEGVVVPDTFVRLHLRPPR